MKSVNPTNMAMGLPRQQLQWAQSVHQSLNGGIDMGVPQTTNSSGFYNTFEKGNSDGVLVCIGPSGGSEQYNWTTAGTPIVISHGLIDAQRNPRQPIGFKIVDSRWDGTGPSPMLYQHPSTPPTTTTISIAPTNAGVGHTIYIF
jgi:hypothetical protein